MSSNKGVKEEMIRRYGAKCFIERLHLRDNSQTHYTGKRQYRRMKMLTYHHIREKSKGGKATVENGALLSAENHQWFHQQPRNDRNSMNRAFQELKRNIDNGLEEIPVVIVPEEELETDVDVNAMIIETDKQGFKVKHKARKKKKRPIKREMRNRGRNEGR